jgi:hypothetical protein
MQDAPDHKGREGYDRYGWSNSCREKDCAGCPGVTTEGRQCICGCHVPAKERTHRRKARPVLPLFGEDKPRGEQ